MATGQQILLWLDLIMSYVWRLRCRLALANEGAWLAANRSAKIGAVEPLCVSLQTLTNHQPFLLCISQTSPTCVPWM